MTAKRVLISIDERLLDRIDQARTRLGLSRSAYLAKLADRELVGSVGPGAAPAARAALATIDDLLRGAER